MYIPGIFEEKDAERIRQFVEDNGFCTLVSFVKGGLYASHLPLIMEGNKLYGHMARANPQWESFSAKEEILAIFQGPNAYISPSWYLSPGVPTWNYVSIHISGKPRITASEKAVLSIIGKLTKKYEAGVDSNWKFDVPAEKRERLLSMIIGFEVEVSTIEAKYKLSQNRPSEDQEAIVSKLDPENSGIVTLMKQRLGQ